MSVVYVEESLSESERAEHPEALRMDRAIQKLRDEITGVAMTQTRGQSRELAFAMGKLDEARQWAIEYLVSIGKLTIVPRGEILRDVSPATDTTVTTETGRASVHV